MTRTKPDTPNFDRIRPNECVNAKLRRLHRLLNNVYQREIRPFGLRGSMLSILFIIGKKPGVNQKIIADRLVLDASTMSRDIKKLTENGWVSMLKGEDPRNTALELTHEGYALLEEVSPVWEALHDKVMTILGRFQIQQIDQLTHALQAHMDEL